MMKTFFSLLSCLLAASSLHATHFWGVKMDYECIGPDSYRIYYTAYFDCRGASSIPWLPVQNPSTLPPPPYIDIEPISFGCSDPIAITDWTLERYEEVTPLTPALRASNTCNDTLQFSPSPAVSSVRYYRDYNFNRFSCPEYLISYKTCCRASALTSVSFNPGIYLGNIKIDLTQNCNSSPSLPLDPIIFLCKGQALTYDLPAIDLDGDSLTFELAPCLEQDIFNDSIRSVAYDTLQGFSFMQPLGPSWQVAIDSLTGTLTFDPQPGEVEVTAICIKINEYRNGIQIGQTYADFMVTVTECPSGSNHAPTLDTVSTQNVNYDSTAKRFLGFAGNIATAQFVFSDPDSADQLSVRILQSNLPGLTLTDTGSNPLVVELSWPMITSMIGATFQATLQITDDGMPYTKQLVLPLSFFVDSTRILSVVSEPGCGLTDGAIDLTIENLIPPYTFQWSHGPTTEDLTNLSAGTYEVTVTDSIGASAKQTFILNSGDIQVDKVVERSCFDSTGRIELAISQGIPPYRISWNTGDTTTFLDSLPTGGYSFTILDSNECQYHEGLLLLPADTCTFTIGGVAYVDANGNCQRDSGEYPIEHVYTRLNTGIGVMTDSTGQYRFQVSALQSPTYTISVPHQRIYQDSCLGDPSYTINLDNPDQALDSLDLPLIFGMDRDLRLTLAGTSTLPTLIPTQYSVTVRNYSNEPMVDNELTLTYPPNFNLTQVSPVPTTWDTTQRVVTWILPALNPGSVRQFYLIANNGVATIGDQFMLRAEINSSTPDQFPSNNLDSLRIRQVGAYDPNIKVPDPVGIGDSGLISPIAYDHIYTVLFQNTGNWPATYVTVRDTLSPTFDLSTFLPLSSTHDYELTIEHDSILVFQFNDIFLPDSTTDPLGSIGQISYFLQHQVGLPIGTELTNKAGIYFDFNPPIITPITLNTLQDTSTATSIDLDRIPFTVYPNPARDMLIMRGQVDFKELSIFDMTGKETYRTSLNGSQIQVQLPTIPKGLYVLDIRTSAGRYRIKWIFQ